MNSNQKCSKCNTPLDLGSKFCGGCGSKVENQQSQIAEELFSIDVTPTKEEEDSEDHWDEFLDSQPDKENSSNQEEDFFAITEDFEDEEDFEEELPSQKEEEKQAPIEKKVFGEEDDPNVQQEEKSEKKEKTLDKKLLKKIQKKQALKIRCKESKISFLFFGLFSLLITFPFLIIAGAQFIPKELFKQLPLDSFQIFSHPIYLIPLFAPSFFRIILNSKIIIKWKGRKQFSQYFAFNTSLFLVFSCASIAQLLSKSSSESLLLSFKYKQQLIQVDHTYIAVLSFLLFSQMIIAFIFAKKLPSIMKIALNCAFSISLFQLYIYLALPSKAILFQADQNALAIKLTYYLGSLHAYIMPNYLLSQLILPILMILFLFYFLKDLISKDIAPSLLAFYGLLVTSSTFLILNHFYLNQSIFTWSTFLKPLYKIISESL
ncbi:zinc ribbon domain-containing protein [bacterium]|nr:zinc ribbon domain-containing protein [bacterium]